MFADAGAMIDGQAASDQAGQPLSKAAAMPAAVHVDLSASEVPLDQPVEFDLSKGEDGLFTIVAVRGGSMPDKLDEALAAAKKIVQSQIGA